ncbi:MAG: tRNA (adenosine(37)-N6)-threonylcarbamoyltransferase complex dimerization subunit type 1 TsaB [Jatrophihabitantaceae bacterium]
MLVLAIDTSSAAVTSAVAELDAAGPADADGLHGRAVRVTINARGHGEYLAPGIAACLAEAGASARELGAIVAGLGPGPFTGLRVGLVTAAVMGEMLDIPTYGVCSLDAIAGHYALDGTGSGTGYGGPERPFLVATDARRKEVYWARYLGGVRVEGPAVSRPADVPMGSRAMAGAGARLYADVLGVPLFTQDYPNATALLRCAVDRIRTGAPSEGLTPLYLRRPDAVPSATSKPVTR